MANKTQWEYKVVAVGGYMGTSDTDLEAKLNELGQAGWEVFTIRPMRQGAGPVSLVAKRLLTASARRQRDWDGT